jgi:hypothetical protein
MPFDRDVIVQFLVGDSFDSIITQGTTDLMLKLHPDPEEDVILSMGDDMVMKSDRDSKEDVISLKGPPGVEHVGADQKAKLQAKLQPSDGAFRLYLRGHGIWENKTLGGWSPQQVAQLLLEANLTKVDLISVTGCNLARNVAIGDETKRVTPSDKESIVDAREGLLKESVNSFAGELHRLLKSLNCKLYGRTYYVNVAGAKSIPNQLSLLYRKHGPGIKATSPTISGGELRQRPFSKILFYWEGGEQKWKWVEYQKR